MRIDAVTTVGVETGSERMLELGGDVARAGRARGSSQQRVITGERHRLEDLADATAVSLGGLDRPLVELALETEHFPLLPALAARKEGAYLGLGEDAVPGRPAPVEASLVLALRDDLVRRSGRRRNDHRQVAASRLLGLLERSDADLRRLGDRDIDDLGDALARALELDRRRLRQAGASGDLAHAVEDHPALHGHGAYVDRGAGRVFRDLALALEDCRLLERAGAQASVQLGDIVGRPHALDLTNRASGARGSPH